MNELPFALLAAASALALVTAGLARRRRGAAPRRDVRLMLAGGAGSGGLALALHSLWSSG